MIKKFMEKKELNELLKDAVEKGCDPRLKQLLIELGANPNSLGVSMYNVITMPPWKAVEVFVNELNEKNPDMNLLKSIIEESQIDINLPYEELNDTLLGYCLQKAAHPEIIKMLLEHPDIDPNAVYDTSHHYPIHVAIYRGLFEVTKMLLEHPKINLDLKVNDEEFLHYSIDVSSAGKGNADAKVSSLALLLNDSRIDINKKNKNGETPLIYVIKEFKWIAIKIIKEIIKHPEIDVNLQDESGLTALTWALEMGLTGIAQMLLERPEIDVNQKVGGWTPLMLASYKGDTEIAQMLLERPEIDVNFQDSHGLTALMKASSRGHTEIVRMLLERPEIDVNLQYHSGETALIMASEGCTEIVKLLLKKPEIDVNVENDSGRNALKTAFSRGRLDIIRLLIKRKDIIVDQQYKWGADIRVSHLDGDKNTVMYNRIMSFIRKHPKLNTQV